MNKATVFANDLHVEWIKWRRELEDSGRRIFNVSRTHYCWETFNGSSEIEVIDYARGLYGCLVCGRLHYCSSEGGACPLVQNPDNDSYACPFSGRKHSDADPGIGTYDGEVLAQTAGRLSDNNGAMYMNIESDRGLRRQANNMSNMASRRKQLGVADHARTLKQIVSKMGAFGRVATQFEPFVKGPNTPTPAVPPPPKQRALPEVSSDLGVRRTTFSDQETARDCDFQARFFADMAAELEHLRPFFAAEPAALRSTGPRSPLSVTEDSPAVVRKQQQQYSTMDGHERLRRILRHVMQAMEILAACRHDLVPPQAWPPFDVRLDYYLHVSACLVESVLGKKLATIQDREMQQHVAVFLLDVLATTMNQRDSFGAQLIVWAADPWLEWCKTRLCIPHLIGQYSGWVTRISQPHTDRISVQDRKRKRADSSDRPPRPGPLFDDATRKAMGALPPAIYSTLVEVAANISHQGNQVRSRLVDSHASPIALYAAVHASLLERRPQYRKRPPKD